MVEYTVYTEKLKLISFEEPKIRRFNPRRLNIPNSCHWIRKFAYMLVIQWQCHMWPTILLIMYNILHSGSNALQNSKWDAD